MFTDQHFFDNTSLNFHNPFRLWEKQNFMACEGLYMYVSSSSNPYASIKSRKVYVMANSNTCIGCNKEEKVDYVCYLASRTKFVCGIHIWKILNSGENLTAKLSRYFLSKHITRKYVVKIFHRLWTKTAISCHKVAGPKFPKQISLFLLYILFFSDKFYAFFNNSLLMKICSEINCWKSLFLF